MRSVTNCPSVPQFFSRLKSVDDPALYNCTHFAEMQGDSDLLLLSFIGGKFPFLINSYPV